MEKIKQAGQSINMLLFSLGYLMILFPLVRATQALFPPRRRKKSLLAADLVVKSLPGCTKSDGLFGWMTVQHIVECFIRIALLLKELKCTAGLFNSSAQ